MMATFVNIPPKDVDLTESIIKVLAESNGFVPEPLDYRLHDTFFDTLFYFKNLRDRDFARHIVRSNTNLKAFKEELEDGNVDFKTEDDYNDFNLEESLSLNKEINSTELLQVAGILAKYQDKIRLVVKGKNKFELQLLDKDLINKDNTVNKLFKSEIN